MADDEQESQELETTQSESNEHKLTKLQKKLSLATSSAVELLKKTMLNTEIDIELRIKCAKDLITFESNVTKQINDDQMAKIIIQMRNDPSKAIILKDGKPTTPSLDFSNIKKI